MYYTLESVKYCEADLTENITSCNSSVTRVSLAISMEVTLITWMGKGGGAKVPTGLQLSLLSGPDGIIHITSIWIWNKCTCLRVVHGKMCIEHSH